MQVRALLAAAIPVAAAAFVAFGTMPAPSASGAPGAYTIEGDHAYVIWRIKHMDVGQSYGRFDKVSGTITFDEADLAASSVVIQIDPASVSTGSQKRDDHLKSPDFFNVAQFPAMSFKSTSVKKVDDTHFDVAGDLTMHGVTNPVTIRMEKTGAGKDPEKWGGKSRIGFEGGLIVQRSKWGMTTPIGPGSTSDDVHMTIAVEALK